MKKVATVLGLMIGSLAIFSQSVQAKPINAIVAEVMDGDTVLLDQGGAAMTLQLACIDAPDWVNGKPQKYAETSKNRLTALIPAGASIQYNRVGNIGTERFLGILLYNNRNINLQMIAEGQAKLHPNYRQTCPQDADALAAAENKAKTQGLGIWK